MDKPQVGVGVPAAAGSGKDLVAFAQTAESLGFDYLSASDHPCGTDPSWETWTMLGWIAAHTSTIAVATRVLGVPYRAPAMVAKMAETLDRLSDGRLILGLGGGSADDEFRAFGLSTPTPGQKVTGLAEAIQIIRGLWSQPSFSFDGALFRTRAADIAPRPGHHIPIWLGTFGDRALEVTGRLADGWIPSHGFVPLAQMKVMRKKVRDAADAAGRSPDSIHCIYNVAVGVGLRDRADPDVVTGSPGEVAEQLASFLAIGFSGLNLMLRGDPHEQLRRLGTEVLPALRGLHP